MQMPRIHKKHREAWKNLSQNIVRPVSEMVRPNHPIKVEIRKGLIVYVSDESKIEAARKKFADK